MLKIKINILRVLVYYDMPELFIGVDEIGTKYLCLFSGEYSKSSYTILPCSDKKINLIERGKLDIREAFVNSETQGWLYGELSNTFLDNVSYHIFDSIPEELLPESGLLLDLVENDDVIIEESIARNSSIVHIKLIDKNNSHSIGIETLADFFHTYQQMVKYAYKKHITLNAKNLKKEVRHSLSKIENFKLNLFATSPGSLNLHLESLSDVGLFGDSEIEHAMKILDSLLNSSLSEDDKIEILKKYKGHLINGLKNISKEVIKRDIDFEYKWCSPSDKKVHKTTLLKTDAVNLLEIISKKEDLTEELREIIGFVTKADTTGTLHSWKIKNEEDDKIYSGTTNIDLSGITINTVRYKFICEEKNEKGVISGNEEVDYKLISFDEEPDSL